MNTFRANAMIDVPEAMDKDTVIRTLHQPIQNLQLGLLLLDNSLHILHPSRRLLLPLLLLFEEYIRRIERLADLGVDIGEGCNEP